MTPIQTRAERMRRVSLESVLRVGGARPDGRDRRKWHTPQGVLSITGPKFMNWSCGKGGGGAIDLVMHLQNRGFMEALQWLERHFATAAPDYQRPPTASPLNLPAPDPSKIWRVADYLILRRGLPPALVIALINEGRIYADARANAVFLLLGKENNPVGAELRSTLASWRGMASGSRKDLGFFVAGPEKSESVVLCESAIDSISCRALHPRHRCISTSGARPHPPWLPELIASGMTVVFCGYDADPVGDKMAKAMTLRVPSVQRLRPLRKDWNEQLRSL